MLHNKGCETSDEKHSVYPDKPGRAWQIWLHKMLHSLFSEERSCLQNQAENVADKLRALV